MRRFVCSALGLVILFMMVLGVGLSTSAAAEKVYINGFDAAYPPFTFIDKKGKPAGFDIDSINWIAKKMGFKVKHKPIEWAAIVPSLKGKKIDMIASGMSITPERKAQVNFSTPYWLVRQLLVVKSDSKLTPEEALKPGHKIGLLRGSAESKWMTKHLLKKGYKFQLRQYDTTELAIEEVANGRVDAAAVSNTALKEAQKKGLKVKSIGGYGQPDVYYGYAVRKGDTQLLKKLNKGLKQLKASSYWKKLTRKWKMK
jgi:polar amino acid transport system substrate-binding protein